MIKLLSIADLVTLTNAIFGFFAILMILLNEMHFSFSFILIALLADGLDGIVARKTRKSELGEYMEAMADMISLGIAPSFFVYNIYYEFVSGCVYYHSLLVGILIVFLSLSIVRLASFHIIKEEKFFVGLPASAGTIFILILSFLFEIDFIYILPCIVVISIAMISTLRFPKIGWKIGAIATVLILLTLIMDDNYYNIAPIFLFIAIAIYTIAGPIYVRKKLL
ncbi:MAG: CDP-alcohol phosphatidyltransferase family protein [Thermoplasmatales archaeon]|nr:MAG: CDP-alcohol phosphatidyltransferase family protein [Thermoplasmatales archaeon]